MRGSTKKITNKLNIQWKKSPKTPLGDFQVTTSETPLLSQQVITSKGIQVPYQPTVEPLPQYPIGLVL